MSADLNKMFFMYTEVLRISGSRLAKLVPKVESFVVNANYHCKSAHNRGTLGRTQLGEIVESHRPLVQPKPG